MKVYGIKNCDTMKKARTWIEARGLSYDFHDYKALGIDRATLDRWMDQVGWDVLLNRSGTTFRKLPDEQRANIDAAKAAELMLAQPSMIKRPIVEKVGKLTVGFKPDVYEKAFG